MHCNPRGHDNCNPDLPGSQTAAIFLSYSGATRRPQPKVANSDDGKDKKSIEHWLSTSKNTTCPVTKQPLPLSNSDDHLIPNHVLRRLNEAWCSGNLSNGVDRITTPKLPLDKTQILKLLKDLRGDHHQLKAIKRLKTLAAESDRNEKFMVETVLQPTNFSDMKFDIPKLRGDNYSVMFIKTKISAGIRGSVDQHDKVKAFHEQFECSDKALASTLIMKFSSLKLTTVKSVCGHIMQMRDIAA
ncbi:hypothetical protein L484_016917 [Morus notabilis]|uniref:U-box domain-containing protein n=1 Tax=Morus notabilis TaxID=981085 RepID=W9RVR6_9ROSA|nr:hypothetical protein L484_016917 [Morus notabilis]